MKQVTKFIAFDGSAFDTEAECKSHEAKKPELRLVGLDAVDIAMAIERTNVELADAIELVAGRIARTRREAGTLRRKPKGTAAPAAAKS